MDITGMKRSVDEIRRHIDAGEKEEAIARCRETFGVDRPAAEQAVEKMMAGEPVAITPAVEITGEEVGRQIEQILQVVPGGGVAGKILRFAGLDLSKIAGTITVEGQGAGKTLRMTLPTMRLPGASQGDASEPAAAPVGRPARTQSEAPRHVSVLDRPRTQTVERTSGFGIVGVAVLLLVLAAAAAAALVLVRHS
jgi:hypothetical protein